MTGSVWRALTIVSASLLTLTSCTLGTEAPGIAPVESAIQLGAASPAPSGPTTPSPSTSESSSGEDGETEDGAATPAGAVFDKDAEIEIEDQVGNGKTVVIDEFEVNIDNLWLVICTKDDRVLSALLTNTESKPVTLTLSSPVTTSQELVAYLFLDDGDGKFNAQLDVAVFEEPGELIGEDFMYEIG